MDATALRPLLRELPHFRSLPGDLVDAISGGCHLRTYETGALVFLEREPCRAFFAVRAGGVKLYRSQADGREQALSMLVSVAGDALLRMKGVVDVAGEAPVALHAVQHQLYPAARLPRWPAHWDGGGEAPGSRRSRIVFIVRDPLTRDYVADAFAHFAAAPVG